MQLPVWLESEKIYAKFRTNESHTILFTHIRNEVIQNCFRGHGQNSNHFRLNSFERNVTKRWKMKMRYKTIIHEWNCLWCNNLRNWNLISSQAKGCGLNEIHLHIWICREVAALFPNNVNENNNFAMMIFRGFFNDNVQCYCYSCALHQPKCRDKYREKILNSNTNSIWNFVYLRFHLNSAFHLLYVFGFFDGFSGFKCKLQILRMFVVAFITIWLKML